MEQSLQIPVTAAQVAAIRALPAYSIGGVLHVSLPELLALLHGPGVIVEPPATVLPAAPPPTVLPDDRGGVGRRRGSDPAPSGDASA